MRLEKVEIQNYRCFNNYEIGFTRGVNVLIGKNGSGKTAIINAIRHGLSFVFAKNTPSNEMQSLATSAEKLKVESPNRMDAFYDETIQDNRYPIAIRCNAKLKGSALPQWEIYKERASGQIFPTKYKEASEAFDNQKYLPVLSIYSDSYPHLESSLSTYAKSILSSGNIIPKNFGYYQWGTESACTEVWEQRFINLWQEIGNKRSALQNYIGDIGNKEREDELLKSLGLTDDKDLNQRQRRYDEFIKEFPEKAAEVKLKLELDYLERELNIITNFLIEFSKPISIISTLDQFKIRGLEVSTRLQVNYLNVRFEDGRTILFQNLPAGYKRLFSIVLDIAYRAYILQLRGEGIFSNSLKKPESVTGIVVIDEIDLHLHPSLEQEVIQRLQDTFPNIQFIVSTHSILVIANLKENEGKNSIIELDCIDRKYSNKKLPNLFGIGYDSVLSDFMGTPPRNSDVKYLAEAYIRLEKREEKEQATAMRKELIKLVGDNNIEKIINSFQVKL